VETSFLQVRISSTRIRRLLLIVSFLSILLMCPSIGYAHARLESSDPAAGSILPVVPPTITMVFTEAIDPAYSSASLVSASGETVSAITLSVDPANGEHVTLTIASPSQPSGTYTVVWRVLSAVDGHAGSGTLSFSAGTGAAPTVNDVGAGEHSPWLTTIGRWLDLAGMMAIAGATMFMLIVTMRDRDGTALRSPARSLRRIAIGAGIVGSVGLAISIVGLAIAATGASWSDPPPVSAWRDTLRDTTPGRALMLRALMLALTIALALIWARRTRLMTIALASLTGIVGLATFSYAGHAAAESHPNIRIAIDLLHLSGGAIWGGGLLVLGLTLMMLLRTNDAGARNAATSLTLVSTSLNLIVMAVIVVTGIVTATARVSGPTNLTGEPYGQALIAKVALVLIVLVIAGVNRLFIVPRLRKARSEGNDAHETGQNERIRQAVSIEIGLALLILLAAARMTEIAPANGPLTVDVASRSGEIHLSTNAGDLTFTLDGLLDPAAAETLSIIVTTTATGEPTFDLARLIVLATAPNPLDPNGEGLRDRFDADPVEGQPGHYTIPRSRLGFDTEWHLSITARRLGLEDATATFPLDLTGTSPQPPRLVSDDWRWPKMPITGWLALMAAVATFTGGIVLVKRLKGLEPVTGGIFLVVITMITIAFFLTAYRSGPIPTAYADRSSPVDLADSAVIQRGSRLFAEQCVSCHGVSGQGTNMAETMGHSESGTIDLTGDRTQQRTDGDLYGVMTAGIPGSEMPAFDIALDDDQRWALVAHIRQLQRDAERSPSPE
jgi:copper transport protein